MLDCCNVCWRAATRWFLVCTLLVRLATCARIEIVSPKNGDVLETNSLEFRVNVHDFAMPRPQHHLCVAIISAHEHEDYCFTEPEVEYHAGGLTAGRVYTLRATLVKDSHVLAISMRTFEVGGVQLPSTMGGGSDGGGGSGSTEQAPPPIVNIQGGMDAALQLHELGMQQEALRIYRQVLRLLPQHADAQHLAGLAQFQLGSHATALRYLQRAVELKPERGSYHNSVGECLKAMGNTAGALHAYERALEAQPGLGAAHYNLGALLRDTGRLQPAMRHMAQVCGWRVRPCDVKRLTAPRPPQACQDGDEEVAHMANAALVAMMRDAGDLQRAEAAVRAALARFPQDGYFWNELGGVKAKACRRHRRHCHRGL